VILRNFANLYGAPLDLTPKEEKELYFLQGTKHKLFLKNYSKLLLGNEITTT